MTVRHNPDEVEAQGRKLTETAEAINVAVDLLRDTAAALEGCFGDGEIGQIMQEQHAEVLETALNVFYESALGVKEAGDDLEEFARTWRKADGSAARDFGRLQDETGG